MHTSRRPKLVILFVLLAVLTGCGTPTPQQVAQQAQADAQELVREAAETGALTNDWSSVDTLFARRSPIELSDRPQFPNGDGLQTLFVKAARYADRVFVDSNVVERPVGALVFALPGSIVCSDPIENPTANAECVKHFDAMGLRLAVSGDLDLALQVGPKHLEPIKVQLRSKKSIAVQVDLALVQQSLESISAALGTDSWVNGVRVVATGRFEVRLEKNGDHDFTMSQSNLTALTGSITLGDAATRSASMAATSPVMSIRVNGPSRSIFASISVGAITANSFVNDLMPSWSASGMPTEAVAASVAGLTAALSVDDRGFSLKRLGLGQSQSTITVSGKPLFALDLNAAHGRELSVSWSATPNALVISVEPALELSVLSRLSALPNRSNIDAALLDDTFTLSTLGLPTSVSLLEGGRFRMHAAPLSLSSASTGAKRSFDNGQCYQSGSSSENIVLDAFQSTPCP